MTTAETILNVVLPLAGTAALSAAAWALHKLSVFLHAKAQTSKLFAISARVSDSALAIVSDLQAVDVPILRAAQTNGGLTGADVVKLRTTALARLKAFLGPEGLKLIEDVLGIAAPSIDSFLSGILEAKVTAISTGNNPAAGLPVVAAVAVPK